MLAQPASANRELSFGPSVKIVLLFYVGDELLAIRIAA
jgi:hypothetical protein